MDDLDLGSTVRGFSSGQRVFKRYVLTKILGRGGMGVVWLAHDEKLDEDVALKFLPEIVKLDAAALDDLKRETKRARQLTHPNIVRIHDLLEDSFTAAIAMEAVEGTTLSQLRVEQPGRVFEVEEIVDWLRQLCAALDYAHDDARVVHRDLKPANIMVDVRGRVKITDFGISQSLTDSVSRASAQRASSGTPAYMSPQQMLGERASSADDIYALGATLYELLTGKPPFYAGNVIVQVQSVTPPPMTERREDLEVDGEPIPSEWELTVADCLAKDPAVRPRSAGEVFERLMNGGPIAFEEDGERPLPVAQPSGSPRHVELPGGVRVELLPIPAGEFYMGSPEDEPGRGDAESPRTHVRITRPFWLASTPVTHAQWRAVMGGGLIEQVRQALEDDTEFDFEGTLKTLRAYWGMERDSDISPRIGPDGEDVAMHYVSWVTACKFCARLNELERAAGRLPEGYVFALPTEAQWEYACRAGTTTATPAGPFEIRGAMNAPVLDAIAWYGGNSSVRFKGNGWDTSHWQEKQYPGGFAGPRNVGLKRANNWGLHDMLGNVWEWCLDEFVPYPGGRIVDPIGRGSVSDRVCRGGAWNSYARVCRSAERNRVGANFCSEEHGFRLALVPVATLPEDSILAGPPGASDEADYPEKPVSGKPWATSLGPDLRLGMRWIPPGTFTMGSPEGEAGAYDVEGPRTVVRISRGFWLGRTPITYGQWKAIMGTSLRDQVRRSIEDDRLYLIAGTNQTIRDYWGVERDSDPYSRIGGEEDYLPMHYVTWDEAMSFCTRLTEQEREAGRLPEGYEYVLPTEAQWEFACRAGTEDATYAGPLDILGENNAPSLDAIAWYGGNSHVGYEGRGWGTENYVDKQYPGAGNAGPRAVAAREPNAWDLYDMLGDVWEWCFDGYGAYPGGTVTDPAAAADEIQRINRGGAWNSRARDCRAACRSWEGRFMRTSWIGFRVALAPVVNEKPAVGAGIGAVGVATAPPTKPAPATRWEKFILLVTVILLLLGALFVALRATTDSSALEEMRNRHAALLLTGWVTEADLAGIEAELDRYRVLGASEWEVDRVRAEVERRRSQLWDDSTSAPPAAEEGSGGEWPMPTLNILVEPGDVAKSAMFGAIDGIDVYFSAVLPDDRQAIMKTNAVGGPVTKLYDAYNPNGVAVYRDYVYWIDPNSGPVTDTQIWRAPKDGYGVPEAIYTGWETGQPILDGSGLAVLEDYDLYVGFSRGVIESQRGSPALLAVDQVAGRVAAIRLDNLELNIVEDGRYEGGFVNEHMQSIAADGRMGFIVAGSGKEGVADPDIVHYFGYTVNQLWSGPPLVSPAGVACNGNLVFVSDPGAGNAIWCVPLFGGEPRRLPVPPGVFQRIGGLALLKTNELIVVDAGSGAVYLLGNLPIREIPVATRGNAWTHALPGVAAKRRDP